MERCQISRKTQTVTKKKPKNNPDGFRVGYLWVIENGGRLRRLIGLPLGEGDSEKANGNLPVFVATFWLGG